MRILGDVDSKAMRRSSGDPATRAQLTPETSDRVISAGAAFLVCLPDPPGAR